MPELPEVQTICNTLTPLLLGKEVAKVTVLLPRMIRKGTVQEIENAVQGKRLEQIKRKGKYLCFTFSDCGYILFHLRMTGRLTYCAPQEQSKERYERLRFTFTDNSALVFGDTRTLGAIYVLSSWDDTGIHGFDFMGIDPLSKEFTFSWLKQQVQGKAMTIKSFLLNQKYIGGLGNIYVDESLFLSHLLPTRRCDSLTEKEISALHQSIRHVLTESLAAGGTSFRDYRTGTGEKGHNQEKLWVYGRKGQRCLACGTVIKYDKIAGRGTQYCPQCQR